MKKHILILFLLSIVTLSAFGQAGSLSQSVYRSRVNDSTTVVPSDAQGYGSIYWNNQATNPGWRVWVDGVGYVIWDPTASAGGWATTTATTTFTGDPSINGGGNILDFSNLVGFSVTADDIALVGTTTGTVDIGTTSNGVQITGNTVKMSAGADDAYFQATNTGNILITGNDDITISAGTGGSTKDVNITSSAGHTHITTGIQGTLWTTTGPFNINTDPGTSGYVLQSNGAGAAPTWVAPSGGGGGVNVFAPNIQTGDYTAVIGDTIQVIYMRNVSTPQTLTIPLNVFPVGSFITVVQDTTAVTTVAGAAGVDIVGRLTLTEKESAVFHQRATNVWARLGGVDQEWTPWTPTFTGFSAGPTGVGGYIVEGKKVTIYYNTTSLGTSNATTLTITNLPFAPKDTMVRLSYVVNNAGGVVGRFLINGGSTTVTFGATPAGSGGFTASSTKGASFDFTYEID